DGELFVPSKMTEGPWSPDAQHGGPPSALLVRALEACPSDTPARLVRITSELLRPVPLTPLRATARIVHASRKVQRVEASLHAVVEGEEPSGAMRALAAADFANGVGWPRSLGSFSHINPDLTVFLAREPHGEWIGLESTAAVDELGAGITDTRLFDVQGLVG